MDISKILLGFGAVIALLIAIVGISTVTTYNGFAKSEAAIQAEDRNIDVIGGSAYVKGKLSAQVATQYGDLVVTAIKAGTEGRYGPDGAKAALLVITEQNPNIDASVYKEVQRTVESAFTDLQTAQTTKNDMIGAYDHQLTTAWGSLVAGTFGFPRIDLEKARQVITTSEMKDARQTGELTAPDLFAK